MPPFNYIYWIEKDTGFRLRVFFVENIIFIMVLITIEGL